MFIRNVRTGSWSQPLHGSPDNLPPKGRIRPTSEPTAPPDQWRCLHHHNITETVAGVSASDLTPVSTQETKTESPVEAAAARLLRLFVCNDCTTAPAPASPATQPTPLPAQATGRALGALLLLHLHPPNLLRGALFRNQNCTNVGRYYGSCSGTQTVSRQNSTS